MKRSDFRRFQAIYDNALHGSCMNSEHSTEFSIRNASLFLNAWKDLLRMREILCFVFGKSIEIFVFMPVVFHEHIFFLIRLQRNSSHRIITYYYMNQTFLARFFFCAAPENRDKAHLCTKILQCGTPWCNENKRSTHKQQ